MIREGGMDECGRGLSQAATMGSYREQVRQRVSFSSLTIEGTQTGKEILTEMNGGGIIGVVVCLEVCNKSPLVFVVVVVEVELGLGIGTCS